MFKVKIAIYKSSDNVESLLFDIITFEDTLISGVIAKVRKWLDELGPY